MRRLFVFLVVLLMLGLPASAGILTWVDLNVGTSAVPGALGLLGLTGDTTVATSAAEFNALLAGGAWDLVIFGEQNTSTYPSVATELSAYVAGGGRVLGTTWLSGSGLAVLSEASSGGDVDVTPMFTDGHPIFAGLGATISLTNPGWGVWSRSWNPTGGAECLGTLGGACAVILGNGGRTLLNGNLFDTFTSLSQGETFIANEIEFLMGGGPGGVPEPATFVLIGGGLLGLALIRRRVVK